MCSMNAVMCLEPFGVELHLGLELVTDSFRVHLEDFLFLTFCVDIPIDEFLGEVFTENFVVLQCDQ